MLPSASPVLQFLPYAAPAHEAAVRAVFQANVPRFFIPEEEAGLLDYLGQGLPYFVGMSGATVYAAGGFAFNHPTPQLPEPSVSLTWGMVHSGWHGRGLGRQLTAYRLQQAGLHYPALPVCIETSHLTASFYEKFGFALLETLPDGVAPGLHLCRMRRPAFHPVPTL